MEQKIRQGNEEIMMTPNCSAAGQREWNNDFQTAHRMGKICGNRTEAGSEVRLLSNSTCFYSVRRSGREFQLSVTPETELCSIPLGTPVSWNKS